LPKPGRKVAEERRQLAFEDADTLSLALPKGLRSSISRKLDHSILSKLGGRTQSATLGAG